MQTRVRRVFYPRTDLPQQGWVPFAELQAIPTRAPAFAQLAGSYQMPRGRRLDLTRQTWETVGWQATFDTQAALQVGARAQLTESFRSLRRPSLDVRQGWQDSGGWIFENLPPSDVYTAAEYPALLESLESYRSLGHRRLDVRSPSLPQDGWTGFVELGQIPTRLPAFTQLTGSFRSARRPDTLRAWQHEWSGPMAWLKGALDLTEPSAEVEITGRLTRPTWIWLTRVIT